MFVICLDLRQLAWYWCMNEYVSLRWIKWMQLTVFWGWMQLMWLRMAVPILWWLLAKVSCWSPPPGLHERWLDWTTRKGPKPASPWSANGWSAYLEVKQNKTIKITFYWQYCLISIEHYFQENIKKYCFFICRQKKKKVKVYLIQFTIERTCF